MRPFILVVFLSASLAAQSAAVPARVFDAGRHAFGDVETLVTDLAKADVVLVGEQHDDPQSHRFELAMLEGLARRRLDGVSVGFEMFERDVQDPLDHFQMGHLTEQEFLAASRPWPNYATDYKPLVDVAVANNWPIFASNAPTTLAAEVSKNGLDGLAALTGKSGDQAKWFAKEVTCKTGDDYFKRFADEMGAHPPATPEDTQRYFQAQCLRDETMAESVAQAYQTGTLGGRRSLVVHFNGSFHTDFAEGLAADAKRRLPGKRIVIVSILPVADLNKVAPDEKEQQRADYLVYVKQ